MLRNVCIAVLHTHYKLLVYSFNNIQIVNALNGSHYLLMTRQQWLFVCHLIDCSLNINTLHEIVLNFNTDIVNGCMVCPLIDYSLSENTPNGLFFL